MWDLSSPNRDQTRTPCTGRWILNHWSTREIPGSSSLTHCLFFPNSILWNTHIVTQVTKDAVTQVGVEECVHGHPSPTSLQVQHRLWHWPVNQPSVCGVSYISTKGFPDGSAGKESACNARDPQFDHWVWKIPWRRERLPTPGFLGSPGGSTGKKNLPAMRET